MFYVKLSDGTYAPVNTPGVTQSFADTRYARIQHTHDYTKPTDVQTMIEDAIAAFREEIGNVQPPSSDPDEPDDPVIIPERMPVPEGTWEPPTTGKKYLIIGTDDDNIGNASFLRMLRTYGFQYTMNVEAEKLGNLVGKDDAGFFTSNDAKQLFTSDITVKQLARYIQLNGLGEVSQHGSSGHTLCDTDMLEGTYFDGVYERYTTAGGNKTSEQLKAAIKDALKDSDIRQNAPYVLRSRDEIENEVGFRIYTVGWWGGSPSCTVDGIDINLNSIKTAAYPWRDNGYLGASTLLGQKYKKNTTTYNIARDTTPSSGTTADKVAYIKSIIDAIEPNHVAEIFWHMPFSDVGSSGIREIFDYVKSFVNTGEMQVVTRTQYINLGTWGGASQPVGPDEPVNPPVVDPEPEEPPVDDGSYPVGLKSTGNWFVIAGRSSGAMFCGNSTTKITEGKLSSSTGRLVFNIDGSASVINGWRSDDEGASWTQVTTNRSVYKSTINTNSTSDQDGVYAFGSGYNEKFELIDSSENFTWTM